MKFISIKNKLLNILSDWILTPPTKDEKTRIDILRNDIGALPLSKNIISEEEWDRLRMELRNNIMKRDPRNFLRWPVVTSTMFFSGKPLELDYLKKLPNWTEYRETIVESPMGNPKKYPYFPASSGNLIHQAYSIALFCRTFSVKINSFRNILEFGGGYGSLTRFIYKIGFTGQYTIFDLAELSFLQQYYLSSIPDLNTNLNKKRISLTTTIEQCAKAVKNEPLDIFIGLWSFSESPVELREKILKAIPQPAYFLIGYREKFNEIDNVGYFKKFTVEHPEYRWIDFPILHLPGNRYIFGKKIK